MKERKHGNGLTSAVAKFMCVSVAVGKVAAVNPVTCMRADTIQRVYGPYTCTEPTEGGREREGEGRSAHTKTKR